MLEEKVSNPLPSSEERDSTENEATKNNLEFPDSHLFREKDEFFACIDQMMPKPTSTHSALASDDDDNNDAETALGTIRSIVDKYLECPTLLDPSLESMVQKLVVQVKAILKQTETIDYDYQIRSIRYPLTALYALAKVRGYKHVVSFLSHQVEDVDLIWKALLSWKTNNENNKHWEALYILWHWMGVLSLVPFHSQVMSGEQGFADQIFSAAKNEVENQTGPVQEAAATCVSLWLCRPDGDLTGFVSWSHGIIQDYVGQKEGSSTRTSSKMNILNRILGVLQCLTKLVKHTSASRQTVIEQLVEPLWDPLLKLADDPSTSGNLLLHRYLVKWWTRTSCAYFPPTRAFAPWRYQRGKRMLLMDQLQTQSARQTTEIVTEGNIGQTPNDRNNGSKTRDEDLFFVPDQVEDAMGRILESLGHSSTFVRWSAAKGVGRLTERLPAPCALDVLDAVLEYFEFPEKDNCWHGACLALAELARKGLLLPASLPDVAREIVKAIHYDVRRGHSSVGSNVRDAACYTFWAFARSYSPKVLRNHLDELAEAVILTSLFDREVNCRRAASAAFQEAVGRQGMASFPHGIFVVTTADFHSLGNRNEAYTTVAAKLAHLDEYRLPIIEHLYRKKLFHWDPSIRQLAARGLAFVAPLHLERMGQVAIPFLLEKSLDAKNLNVRHGAVLGVAELIRVLGAQNSVLETHVSQETRTKMLDLVNQIEKRRLYRGRGGEIMRVAVCRLVECISLALIPLDVKTQVQMLDSVDASIPHPNEEIQLCACAALEQLFQAYFPVSEKGPTERLRTRVLEKFIRTLNTSKNPAATRGYALALGHLPDRLLAPTSASLSSTLKALCGASSPRAKVDGEADAETRRNAIRSIARVVTTVVYSTMAPIQTRVYPVASITGDQLSAAVDALFLSLDDYNVDRRGDVGSWCRVAAMEGLSSLILLCSEVSEEMKLDFTTLDGTKFVGLLIKQLSERLDAVRSCAGCCLQKVLSRDNASFPEIEGKNELISVFQLRERIMDSNWADLESVFRQAMAAAVVQDTMHRDESHYPYYDSAIAGIVASVGGKAESPHATTALLDHARHVNGTEAQARLCNSLLTLFEQYSGVGRVTLPLLRTLVKLFARKCFDGPLQGEEIDFGASLLKHLEHEFEGCRDMDRLVALAEVTAALINASPVSAPYRHQSLGFLCKMLEHRYPRFRSRVAEIVYMIIIEDEKAEADISSKENTIAMVLETPWGSDMSYEDVRQSTAQLKKGLGFVG